MVKKLKSVFLVFIGFFRLMPLRVVELVGQFFPENSYGCQLRGFLYKPFLKSCGVNFQVALSVKMENLKNIEIGNNVYVGHGSWINGGGAGVNLEDEVILGPYVTMVAGNHAMKNGSYRYASAIPRPILIKKGTWLCAKSTVVAGVTIGSGVLVAANAVVTKDVEHDDKVGGIPAKSLLK